MTTPTTPPPVGDTRQRRPLGPVGIVLAVLGGLILLGVIAGAVNQSVATLSRSHTVLTADAKGTTDLKVNAEAGQFTLEFADTPEAVLDVRSSRGSWSLERRGNTLEVKPPGGWQSWCFLGCDRSRNDVKLTLPRELDNGQLNATLNLEAGELLANGNFARLDLDVDAGYLRANGSATSLDVDLGAGQADVVLADVADATYAVAAGRLNSELTGKAPATVDAQVSAGLLDLTLPDTSYSVASEVSAGSVDNRLQVSSNSSHQVGLQVSAGSVLLHPGAPPTGDGR
ncbi:hypothetical protein [Glutamicibacter sp. V16R2B1]|uniref:hypothetical protein n=1 Tax=Glutamicibacter TaxID=1742989 RepID=UPI0010FD0ACE|nr:hypothetical protein [Glutamicibacter sp. V16R2B1]TLK52668.1 hypothetical protein FDN03_07420 [Glutamicibacter sp. V16R2B1]